MMMMTMMMLLVKLMMAVGAVQMTMQEGQAKK